MNVPPAPGEGQPRREASGRPAWLAGLGWKVFIAVLLLSLLDAARRMSPIGFDDHMTATERLLWVLLNFAWPFLLAVPAAFVVIVTYNLFYRRSGWFYIALAASLAAASILALSLAMLVEWRFACPEESMQACHGYAEGTPMAWMIAKALIRYGPLCALFAAVFVHLRIADDSVQRAADADTARQRHLQQVEEARLAMLQAQIEPHFLFNTLANVRRLYQTSPPEANAMMNHLMRYLEVALPQMRAHDSTLGREIDLTASYLAIQRTRMGQRLAVGFDVPPSLRDARIPPMMVLTLAENAIKHGLAPSPGDGTLTITACADDGVLEVRVADSGRGFTQSSGGGTGLANIRARLAGHYGGAGTLVLARNTPRGVVATIRVPLLREKAMAGTTAVTAAEQ